MFIQILRGQKEKFALRQKGVARVRLPGTKPQGSLFCAESVRCLAVCFNPVSIFSGALSPLHTRRGAHGAVAPTPDFAEFDCFIECPKLITVSSEEHCRDIAAAFSDLVISCLVLS